MAAPQLILFLAMLGLSSAGFFSKTNVLIQGFRYQKCSEQSFHGIVDLSGVRVASTAEGDIVVSGVMSTALNLTSPIQAKLKIWRRLLGVNVPMPCIRQLGSCNYADLCHFGLLPSETCPGALEENDVPCRCPIEQGQYNLPGAQFAISPTRWAGILAATYKGQVQFASQGRLLACYQFMVELQ